MGFPNSDEQKEARKASHGQGSPRVGGDQGYGGLYPFYVNFYIRLLFRLKLISF